MKNQKRLRIFAGPNGSGKSTIINIIRDNGIDLGVYVNADEINLKLLTGEGVNFSDYNLNIFTNTVQNELENTTFFKEENTKKIVTDVIFLENNILYCSHKALCEYISAFIADFIRNQLIGICLKFSFETVMSHDSKLEFIKKASDLGYKTYMYFVSLEDPELNKKRVKARVQSNGHDVPEDKIVSRYYKTMGLLYDALKLVDKAYLFDNSGSKYILFAKSVNSEIFIEDVNLVPQWFYTYVLNKNRSMQ